MSRRQFAGGAKETITTGTVASSGAVSIAITDATGWPDASVGPFAVVIDPGTASEEKVLVTARVGLTLTVTAPNRGYDGTSAIAHATGAVIYHTFTAIDFDEANDHVNDTSAAHAATAISNAPAGTIAATTVQAAINELDTEKAATSHTQASSTITDFAEAVQDVVGAMFTDGTGIDSSYNDGANTLTVASTGPLGRMASASITATAGAAGASQTDVSGLSVTFTMIAGRKYRAGFSGNTTGSDTDITHQVFIVQVGQTPVGYSAGNVGQGPYLPHHPTLDLVTAAGSCTVKVAIARSGGGSNINVFASATYPAQLWVDDVGLT